MLNFFLHTAGREYTAAVAVPAVPFVLIPALVSISQPLSYLSLLAVRDSELLASAVKGDIAATVKPNQISVGSAQCK